LSIVGLEPTPYNDCETLLDGSRKQAVPAPYNDLGGTN